jgi:hypothetical protein
MTILRHCGDTYARPGGYASYGTDDLVFLT